MYPCFECPPANHSGLWFRTVVNCKLCFIACTTRDTVLLEVKCLQAQFFVLKRWCTAAICKHKDSRSLAAREFNFAKCGATLKKCCHHCRRQKKWIFGLAAVLLRCCCSNIVKIKCKLFTYLLLISSFWLYFNYFVILNGQVKFCQGKYLFWCTCPVDEFKKKLLWIPG